MPAPNAAETAKTESANPDDFLDPDEVVAEDGKETDDTFFWKVCVLCEAHMRRSNDSSRESR